MKREEDGRVVPVSKEEVGRWNERIWKMCNKLAEVLSEKNIRYNNSVFSPLGIFSTLTPLEGAKIRLDDKLKRIIAMTAGMSDDKEDAVFDLMGYLVCYHVIKDAEEK